jgi:hypothetical protein
MLVGRDEPHQPPFIVIAVESDTGVNNVVTRDLGGRITRVSDYGGHTEDETEQRKGTFGQWRSCSLESYKGRRTRY